MSPGPLRGPSAALPTPSEGNARPHRRPFPVPAERQMLYFVFDKALDSSEVSWSWKLYFYPNDLEALASIRKVDFKPALLSINEIKECGLNGFLGSYFSTFGIVRCSLAFLKTERIVKEKPSGKSSKIEGYFTCHFTWLYSCLMCVLLKSPEVSLAKSKSNENTEES